MSAEEDLHETDGIILNRLKPLTRFLPPEEFGPLVAGMFTEMRLREEISFWEKISALGLRTTAEAALLVKSSKREDV